MVLYFALKKNRLFLTGKGDPEHMFINKLTITFPFFSKLTSDTKLLDKDFSQQL